MIKVGDRVQTGSDSGFIIGTVKNIYHLDRDYIVVINAGNRLIKRRIDEITLITEEPDKTSDEITITREEFIRKFTEAIVSEKTDDPSVTLSLTVSGVIILKKLEKLLFDEK